MVVLYRFAGLTSKIGYKNSKFMETFVGATGLMLIGFFLGYLWNRVEWTRWRRTARKAVNESHHATEQAKHAMKLLVKSEEDVSNLRGDIYYLVSTDPLHGAKAKQVYDRWRATFGLTEKQEQPSEN